MKARMEEHQAITTHPANWVDDGPVTGKLHAKGDELRLEFQGYDYVVIPRRARPEEEFDGEPFWLIKLFFTDQREHPVVVVTRMDGEWVAFHEEISDASLTREADDPIAAAIKILANVT